MAKRRVEELQKTHTNIKEKNILLERTSISHNTVKNNHRDFMSISYFFNCARYFQKNKNGVSIG